jgi:hypothetical protein
MANVNTSLTSPELVFAANTAILKAQRAIAKLTKFATDFTPEAAQPGSTMMIQFFDDGEAAEYNESTNNYSHADGSTSFIPVTFTNHPKKSFAFTPQDFLAVNGSKFWENSGAAAGRAVEIAILKTVSQYFNPTLIPTSGQDKYVDGTGRVTGTLLDFGAWNEQVFGTGAFDKNAVAIKARQYCDAAEINPGECVLMLNAKAYGEVLASLDANLYGGPEAIRFGMIEGLYGFDAVMENDCLPKDANLVGVIIPRNAVGIAGRVLPVLNPKLYEEVGTVTDEHSGLTLQFRRGGAWETDRAVMTCEALFGAKLLQPTKIVRIVSAATPAPTGETGATGETGPTGE